MPDVQQALYIMTHIIAIEPKAQPFLLLRPEKDIRVGDKVIFQWEGIPPHSPESNPITAEAEVLITDVQDGKGLMKGWQIISWHKELPNAS